MTREEKAIIYFKDMRKRLCDNYLLGIPKDSVAYKATMAEKEFYDTAIKALEQTRWISVNERLPDIHNCFQECLITNKHKSVYKAFFTDINGKQWWSVDDVIAWMPLPQSYKAESEE